MKQSNTHALQSLSGTVDKTVIDLASQCVKCGLCLPHCPTYELTQDENESPRGRIELLKAVAQNYLTPDSTVIRHIDQCLTCRACERVCPAKVEYGKLLTTGRTLLQQPNVNRSHPLKRNNLIHRWLNTIVSHPAQFNLLHWLLWGLERSGLRALSTKLKITNLIGLNSLNQLLPTVSKPCKFKPFYPAFAGNKVGTVGLFLGCVQKLTDSMLYQDAIQVLTHWGYDVYVAADQTCCGAIALHDGHAQRAQQLMTKNLHAFSPGTLSHEVDYIVTLASGCGTTLHDYEKYLHADITQEGNVQSFAKKIVDISTLIYNTTWPANLKLKKFEKKIALHAPCTLKNVWQTQMHSEQLLQRLPGAQITRINHPHCCGAAGTYMIDFSDISEALGDALFNAIEPLQADIFATSNIGCALHMNRIFKNRGVNIEVLHPITLLSKSIIL